MAKVATNKTSAKSKAKAPKSSKVVKNSSSSDEMPKTSTKAASKAKTRDSGKKKKGAHTLSNILTSGSL